MPCLHKGVAPGRSCVTVAGEASLTRALTAAPRGMFVPSGHFLRASDPKQGEFDVTAPPQKAVMSASLNAHTLVGGSVAFPSRGNSG